MRWRAQSLSLSARIGIARPAFPRPCSELEKSPDTISTSTKRHEPPSERLSPRCTCPGEDVRRRRDERRLRRERRGRREWRRACLRVCCVCFCVMQVVLVRVLRVLRVRVLLRALVLVRVLRHARVRVLLRHARVRRHVLRSWFPPTPGNPGTPPVRVLVVRVRRA